MYQLLCNLTDIPDNQSRGFLRVEQTDRIFAIRRGTELFLYVNDCPHDHLALNFAKDRYLNSDATKIICFAHAAHFDIASGECTDGPCEGAHLTRIPYIIENGQVLIPTELPSASPRIAAAP